MKLFKIWQTKNNNCDTYNNAVVAAESEEDAANISPDPDDKCTWVSPDKVFVRLIGTATPETKRGIICASFRAK